MHSVLFLFVVYTFSKVEIYVRTWISIDPQDKVWVWKHPSSWLHLCLGVMFSCKNIHVIFWIYFAWMKMKSYNLLFNYKTRTYPQTRTYICARVYVCVYFSVEIYNEIIMKNEVPNIAVLLLFQWYKYRIILGIDMSTPWIWWTYLTLFHDIKAQWQKKYLQVRSNSHYYTWKFLQRRNKKIPWVFSKKKQPKITICYEVLCRSVGLFHSCRLYLIVDMYDQLVVELRVFEYGGHSPVSCQ